MVTLTAPPPALHPADRRRLATLTPPAKEHPVLLRPLGSSLRGPSSAPLSDLIVTSKEQKFIDALYADLQRPDWRTSVDAMRDRRRGDADKILELHLPLHKRTQIVLYEAVCVAPGTPRLDPKKITSAGFVLRRKGTSGWEGWCKLNGRRIGWKPVGDDDPNAKQRRLTHKANAAIRAQIALRQGVLAETEEEFTTLFVAPPEVCEARGKTILIGVIPVTSSETHDEDPAGIDYSALDASDRADMIGQLSSYLKPRAPTSMPKAGALLDPRWDVLTVPGIASDDESSPVEARLKAFGLFLHQLSGQLDALGTGPAATTLMGLLGQLNLPLADGTDVDAATFARQAIPVLLESDPLDAGDANPNTTVTMPTSWPRIDDDLGKRISAAALDCLSARFAALSVARPKFDRDQDLFAVRGYVRIKGHGDCPETLHWGDYTEPFRILPWWDGDGPAAKIKLPDMKQLRKVKPNVQFELPPALAGLLSGDMKALAKGEDPGKGLEIGWLCSFSLPIITLCAFIVLNIFLGLLNIFLQWMVYVKICIPIPKKAS
jgi:hypothetical protein